MAKLQTLTVSEVKESIEIIEEHEGVIRLPILHAEENAAYWLNGTKDMAVELLRTGEYEILSQSDAVMTIHPVDVE